MTRWHWHTILLSLFIALGVCRLPGQHSAYLDIQTLDDSDGLVGIRTTAALQDSKGFIWIATVDALNRYDGHNFIPFHRLNSELQYENVVPKGLAEDDQGFLWLQYAERVEFIHHQTFEVLTFESRFDNAPFQSQEIEKIYVDQSSKAVLIQLKGSTYYLFQKNQLRPLPFLKGASIIALQQGRIYFQTDTTTVSNYEITTEGLQSVSFPHAPDFISVFSERGYCLATYDGQELSLWLYENDQVIHKTSLPFQFIKNETPFSFGLGIDQWTFSYYPPKDCFILSDLSSSEAGKTIYLVYKNGTLEKLPINDKVSLQFTDNTGLLWLAGLDKLYQVDIKPRLFDYYEGVDNARGIWANHEKVFVASSSAYDMMYQINGENLGVIYQELYATAKDQSTMWGGDKGMFGTFDLETGQLNPKVPIKRYLKGNIWSCLHDQEGNWWMSHDNFNEDRRICFYNPTTDDSLDVYRQYNDFRYLEDALVIQLLEDGQYIWATSNLGLILIDKDQGVQAHYSKTSEAGFRLPFDDVHFLYKDEAGIYWAATNHDGLVCFRLNEAREVIDIKQYTTAQFLSADVLYYIVEDKFDRLWISTLNGITCFDKKTEQVRIFAQGEHLPIREFNRTSGFQATDGRIYFGGVKGAVGFHPSDFPQSTYNTPLLLSKVTYAEGLEETVVDKTWEVRSANTITQLPSTSSINIQVALADYRASDMAQYYYKVEGMHQNFRLMKGNEVQLGNLPYGDHRIIFKGQTEDKRFSTQTIELDLLVIRPFYLRWWFIMLILGAIFALSTLLNNWRIRQLKKRQTELEDIVVQRTEKIRQDKLLIEQQAEDLKALDQLKDRFFANISHELRTPLTLILAPLSNLLEDQSDLNNKQFTYLQVIKRHTNYLLKRINEILELNRLEVNKAQVDLQPTKLYDFLKLTLGNFESIAPQKQILFSFDFQMPKTMRILTDKDKLEHIIYNFLSNAFKYTPKEGKVAVIVNEVSNKMRLEVKDSGVGIPAEDIPNLFERFFQAENAQKSGSSGIGLALCREIAEILNGQVWAESEVGKGSSFFFEMPFEEFIGIIEDENYQQETEQVVLTQLEKSPLMGSNTSVTKDSPTEAIIPILLVEDNPELREYIRLMLSEYYQVHTAENGQQALEWLSENQEPTLIVSDLMMPVMDGLELLEEVKKSDAHRHIPVLMLTARQSLETKLSALQLGVDDYVTKPFNEQELLMRIRNLLNNRQERLSFIKEELNQSAGDASRNSQDELALHISMTKEEQEWLEQLEMIVTENIKNSQFTVTDCAQEFFLSDRQLQRRIKKCTGLNFTRYVRLARLRQARQILEHGEGGTVAQVAYQVGFETPAYFSKLFLQEYGRKASSYLRT